MIPVNPGHHVILYSFGQDDTIYRIYMSILIIM